MEAHVKRTPSKKRALFDPLQKRKSCETFMLDFLAGTQFAEDSPRGMVADGQADDMVYCTLVGFGSNVSSLIPRRIEWLDHALLGSKFPAENTAFQRASMLKAKAIYLWLLREGELARLAWRQAVYEHEFHLLDPNATHRNSAALDYDLDDHMGMCLMADDCERAITNFQRIRPGNEPTAARARTPREWGYVACRNELHPTLSDNELEGTGRRMLSRWLDDPWLGRGQASRAAMWLMAVHWLPDRNLTPEQTLFKAYDDLPLVTRPDFAVE